MGYRLMAIGLGVFALGGARAEAQAPSIGGNWKLNIEESENTQEKVRLAMRGETVEEGRPGYGGGGRVTVGTGRVREVGGGAGGGGAAGGGPPGGGGGGGAPGPSAGPMRRIMRPAAQIAIEWSDSVIVIRDGGEIPQRIYLDGRTMQEPALGGPAAEVTAKWKDGKLIVERKSGDIDTMKETYFIDKKTSRLVVEAKVTSSTFLRPLEIKRVYDRVTPGQ